MENRLVIAAQESLESGVSLQSEVHRILDKDGLSQDKALAEIAEACGAFRTKAQQEYVLSTKVDEERTDLVKKINNIVNDISRICRDKTGMSITMESRSNGTYLYKVSEPKPRAAPKTSKVSTSTKVSCEAIEALVEKFPVTVMTCFLKQYKEDSFYEILRDAVGQLAEKEHGGE